MASILSLKWEEMLPSGMEGLWAGRGRGAEAGCAAWSGPRGPEAGGRHGLQSTRQRVGGKSWGSLGWIFSDTRDPR